MTRKKLTPSRDDMRAVLRLAKREANEEDVDVKIKPSARKRLNWLVKNYFKCDSQSMAINILYLRVTGSLEVPPRKEQGR